MKLKVVTVATHSERYFPILVQSCERFGLELVILGWNSKWTGFTYKFDLVKQFLKQQDPDTLVVFVDAYDVVFLQPAQVIIDNFIKSNAKIIIAKDWNLMFHYELGARVGFGLCNGTRINSGTYMGKVAHLIQMFDTMCNHNAGCKDHEQDDQVMITNYCKLYPDLVSIDLSMQLFIAVSSEKNSVLDLKAAKLSIIDNQLVYDQRLSPCIIHVPFNTRIDQLLKDLGFDISQINDSDFKGVKKSILYIAGTVAFLLILAIIMILRLNTSS